MRSVNTGSSDPVFRDRSASSNRWMVKILQILFSIYGVGIGLALIVTAALWAANRPIASPILSKVGEALIVFGLFELAHHYVLRESYGRDLIKAQRIVLTELLSTYSHFRSQGLRDVYPILPSSVLRRLLGLSRKIVISKTWFPYDPGIVQGLHEALKRGAEVVLYLCDADSAIMRHRSVAARTNPLEGMARNLEAVHMALNWLNQGLPGRISIFFYDAWPGHPIIQCDHGIFEGSYLRGSTSPLSQWRYIDHGSDHGRALAAQLQFQDGEITESLTDKESMRRWYDRHSPHRPSRGEAEAA